MNYKALFLDIDGTILKPDHTYTAKTKTAILQAQEKGLEVFLATGRPFHELIDLANELNIQSFIGYNGAYGTYHQQVQIDKPIDQTLIRKCIEISQANNHEIVFYTKDKNYFTSLDSPVSLHFIEAFQLRFNNLYSEEVSDKVLGVTLMNVAEEETSLYKFVDDIHLSQVNIEGLEQCYDFIRDSVNKGEAVQYMINLLNINKDQAIAFGDGMNDKEMFQVVGESFAMGNADERLIAYAKHQTTTVEQSGIYEGLKKLGIVTE